MRRVVPIKEVRQPRFFDETKCDGCPIQGEFTPCQHAGPVDAPYVVVSDIPKPADAKAGRVMSSQQMTVFAKEVSKHGFGREDFVFLPAIRCPYDPEREPTAVRKEIAKKCRAHLVDAITYTDRQAVLPLGAEAAKMTFGRGVKITEVRGNAVHSDEFDLQLFSLLSPGAVLRYPQNAPIFSADVASFARFIDADQDIDAIAASMVGDYQIVDDLQFLIDANPEVVSFDTETTHLRWYKTGPTVRSYRESHHQGKTAFSPRAQILTMQFCIEPGKSYMLVWDHPEAPIAEERKARIRNQLRRLLCDPDRIVVGQNLKYDNVMMWALEGIRFRIGGDTLMLATLDDENAMNRSLDVLTKVHVPEMAGYADAFNNQYDKSRMWEIPLHALRNYGCGDTDAALRVYLKLEEKISRDAKLWSHYVNVSLPGLNALAGMEIRGQRIDQQHAVPEFQAFMEQEVARQRQELLDAIPKSIKQKHLAMCKGDAEKAFSFSRKAFMADILFDHPDGYRLKPKVFTKSTEKLADQSLRVPSTSTKDHLPYFFDECPFTMQLAEHVKDVRLLDTNVKGFNEKYVVNGYVRPVYSLSKTVTGRTASEDPNGQNFPKRGARAKAYRRIFIADDDHYICELDLSQAELRIAACMANERVMIRLYQNGGDIHTETALIVLGTTMERFRELPKQEQKDARTKAKAVNFGFLYGMGWKKFIGYAKTQYGVDFTEKEAKRIRAGFFSKYKGLEAWHERMREFARTHGFVRSFSGRIRHLPMIDSDDEGTQAEAFRQAINSPVQEFGSSLGVMAIGRINEEVSEAYLQVVGFVHDAILIKVRKEHLDWGLRTVKRYMQSNPLDEWFGVTLPVPIVADCGFGESGDKILELEGFSLDEPFDYSSLVDKDGNPLICVPPQQVPPNDGRLDGSPYTEPDDGEDEGVYARTSRARTVRFASTKTVAALLS